MIISVVAAKIWYLQKCTVFIGPPCIPFYFIIAFNSVFHKMVVVLCTHILITKTLHQSARQRGPRWAWTWCKQCKNVSLMTCVLIKIIIGLSHIPEFRLQSRGLESLTAGLQSLRLASRLKPWLRTIDVLGWLMAAIATACGYKQEN